MEYIESVNLSKINMTPGEFINYARTKGCEVILDDYDNRIWLKSERGQTFVNPKS